MSIEGHMMFTVLSDKVPLVIDRDLILVPRKSEDNNNRFVPFPGKGLLELQNFDQFLNAEVQSRYSQVYRSAVCIW
jgi:hypothetical protein